MPTTPDSSYWDAAAVIVSVCALFLTVYTAWLSRQHNRVSVRPKLAAFLTRNMESNDATSILLLDLALTNTGLGPAHITTYQLLIDGEVSAIDASGSMFAVVKQAMPGDYIRDRCVFGVMKKEYVMAAGERFSVAQLAIRNPDPATEEKMKRFHLRVEFRSMYDETFVYDTRSHL